MKPGAVDHAKTLLLARRLKASRVKPSYQAQAAGHIAALWAWAWGRTDDGDLSLFEPEDIASAGKWRGSPEAFLDLLLDVGYLDRRSDGSLWLHDADDHRPEYVRKRVAERDRRRREKDAKAGRVPPRIPPRETEQVSDVCRKKSRTCSPPSASASAVATGSDPSATVENDSTGYPLDDRASPAGGNGQGHEANPHPPAEPTPPARRRGLMNPDADAVAEALRRLATARGGREVEPTRQGHMSQAEAKAHSLGAASFLRVVDAYGRAEHPRAAAKTLGELMCQWDHFAGLAGGSTTGDAFHEDDDPLENVICSKPRTQR